MGEVMAFERLSGESLEYFPCRYGGSKLLFRGPRQDTNGAFVAVLGGSETHGKFVAAPFTDILAKDTGHSIVNLGFMNAGVDLFGTDQAVIDLCRKAQSVVLQVMGAQNLSNGYYTVHPRRNDRFLKASGRLRRLYPEIDFVRFHFTRHLLTSLRDCCPERFEHVREELKRTWVSRMQILLRRIAGDVTLLWISDRSPDERPADEIGSDPVMIERQMLDQLAGKVSTLVEVVASDKACVRNLEGKICSDLEAPIAAEMPGPALHREVAEALARALPVLA